MENLGSYSLILLVTLLSASCNSFPKTDAEETLICGTLNPLDDLTWLNEQYLLIEDEPGMNGILAYSHDEMTIIEIQSALMSSTNRSQYTCDGSLLDFFSQDKAEDYSRYLEERTLVVKLFGTKLWN